jgi:glyoxylase-like metal-dependent hydrolase (beta-lactamase superfamily II)
MFVKQMEVGNFSVFAYVVGCERTKEALVIDPAAETSRILLEAGSRGYTIRYIVNTHSHLDHTMGNRSMKQLTGSKIVIHALEAPSLVHQPPYLLAVFSAEPSPPADVTVLDGDEIRVGDVSLRVIHTPGHSRGSICLYAEGIVFTGDTLFVGGVGRTDLEGGSWEELQRSIKERLFVLPDETIVAPGHNYGSEPRSTIGREKRSNPFVRGL